PPAVAPTEANEQTLISRTSPEDAALLAGRRLSARRTSLSGRESSFKRADEARAHQAAASGPLGDFAGPEFYLCAFESPDQKETRQHHLYRRAGTRRPGVGR